MPRFKLIAPPQHDGIYTDFQFKDDDPRKHYQLTAINGGKSWYGYIRTLETDDGPFVYEPEDMPTELIEELKQIVLPFL